MSKVKPAPLPPDTVIGGYRIVRKLAAGGFGVVYLAVDTEGQQVAVKEYLPSSLATRGPGELLPQVQPEKLSLYRLGLKSFFEEGRALAQISHQSVVSVLNFFRENETVYMVMNYLEGASLQEFIITARELKRQKVFRESTIRSLYDEVLRGLRIVHQHKMLHLDIKPANIFITNDNKAVLLDFGATQEFTMDFVDRFRRITRAIVARDRATIAEQAVALFGDLVIGVMHNPDKPSGMFSPAERADLVRQSVAHLGKKVCVETYGGLTVEAASKIEATFIIKSARTGGDFEVEQQMAQTNQGASGIETILLFSRPEHSFISSRYIRQFVGFSGTNATPMVSTPVLKALIAKQTPGAKK